MWGSSSNSQSSSQDVDRCPFQFCGEIVVSGDAPYVCAAKEDFMKFREFCDTMDGWTLAYDGGDGIYTWDQKPQKGQLFNLVKAFATFPCTPAVMYDVIHDPEYRKEWDDNMIKGYNICQLNANNDVGYYSAKMPTPIANRDFCNQRCWMRCGNEEYIVFNTSVKHKGQPEVKGFVRAWSLISGYLIRPWGDDGCCLTYVTQTNPRGWLPAYVVNMATRKLSPNLMIKLREVSTKYAEWKKKHNPDRKPWITPEDMWDCDVPYDTIEWVIARMKKGNMATPVAPTPGSPYFGNRTPASAASPKTKEEPVKSPTSPKQNGTKSGDESSRKDDDEEM